MNKTLSNKTWRKSGQYLLPDIKPLSEEDSYDIYPSLKLDDNLISEGFESLAGLFLKHRLIIIDGSVGVFYDHFRGKSDRYLKSKGVKTAWINTSDFFLNQEVIEEMISPFMGEDDPLFGKRTSLSLEDFFEIPGYKMLHLIRKRI